MAGQVEYLLSCALNGISPEFGYLPDGLARLLPISDLREAEDDHGVRRCWGRTAEGCRRSVAFGADGKHAIAIPDPAVSAHPDGMGQKPPDERFVPPDSHPQRFKERDAVGEDCYVRGRSTNIEGHGILLAVC